MQFRKLLIIAALATSVSAGNGYTWAYCQNLPSGGDDSGATAGVCNSLVPAGTCSDCKVQQALLDPQRITKCTSVGRNIDPRNWANRCRDSMYGAGRKTGIGN
ncbi:hypothetical protein HYFRA_00007262 [Hymenoscyphus fraxineus]|uniref:Uncharacterized protein n=1 Tax=Hymenoscyphus fraxineus TaxID=746836 RepID=A0A9N9PLN7_9HELO|nr:hypothetical protein HYFRA_00007262 [Hymenoscyphus fraxineus]